MFIFNDVQNERADTNLQVVRGHEANNCIQSVEPHVTELSNPKYCKGKRSQHYEKVPYVSIPQVTKKGSYVFQQSFLLIHLCYQAFLQTLLFSLLLLAI